MHPATVSIYRFCLVRFLLLLALAKFLQATLTEVFARSNLLLHTAAELVTKSENDGSCHDDNHNTRYNQRLLRLLRLLSLELGLSLLLKFRLPLLQEEI